MYIHRRVIKEISKYNKVYEYYTNKGNKITNKETLDYIKSLKIPPAYENVIINPNKNAKLLATGYDVKGKKQYIYNEKWIKTRGRKKFCNMIAFGRKLPKINHDVLTNMNHKKIDKKKLVALIIRIIMECNFRIGNPVGKDIYDSYGITTIMRDHIEINGNNVKIDFTGKRGVRNMCILKDPNTKQVLKDIYKVSRNNVFMYREEGKKYNITSYDVNDFLKQYGDFTSKDFRTWYANIYFINEIMALGEIPDKITHRKKYVREAIKNAAEKLHHTVAICKKKYIVMDMINMYIEHPGRFKRRVVKNYHTKGKLDAASHAFISFLEKYCK